jgi:predicted DNA-binding transcriptional regulator AlpA
MKRRDDRSSAPDVRPLLTRSEVDATYGVPKRFLELAPARGEGPRFVRIGRSVRYRPEDVEAWLETMIVDPSKERR